MASASRSSTGPRRRLALGDDLDEDAAQANEDEAAEAGLVAHAEDELDSRRRHLLEVNLAWDFRPELAGEDRRDLMIGGFDLRAHR